MVFRIKRENWAGKLRVVARRDGKLVTWKPFSPKKGQTVKLLKAQFRKSKSFDKDVSRFELVNVVEITDLRKDVSPPRGKKFQGYAEGIVNSTLIQARSQNKDPGESFKDAIMEALESLYERIAQALDLTYDAEKGLKAVQQRKIMVRTGIIHYSPR